MPQDEFTLEKMKIREDINAMEKTLSTLVLETQLRNKWHEESIKSMTDNIDMLNKWVNGHGDNKGASEKIRVLEGAEDDRKNHIRFIWGAIGTGFFATIGEKIWKIFNNS